MIDIIRADGRLEQEKISAMRARAAQANENIDRSVAEIIRSVKENGFAAVKEYSLRFDRAEPYEISREMLDAAYDRCPAELTGALERAAANIRDYNEKLLAKTMEWTSPDGGTVGRVVRGLTRVGIYVPGGTAAYPSSVLMNAVPAKVAGVEEIVMVTPPTGKPQRRGAGGGQDRRGGPGHRRGRRPGGGRADLRRGLHPPGGQAGGARQRLCGRRQADGLRPAWTSTWWPARPRCWSLPTARRIPSYVAADLLSQAEHDRLASAVLLTDSMRAGPGGGRRDRPPDRLSGPLGDH